MMSMSGEAAISLTLAKAWGMPQAAAAASALFRLEFATPAISNLSERKRRAGRWANAAGLQPNDADARLGVDHGVLKSGQRVAPGSDATSPNMSGRRTA